MTIDNDPRTTAELVAEMNRLFKEHLEYLYEDFGNQAVSMTAATVSIYGESGKGHWRAVKIIETLGDYGYLEITGNKRRRVTFTDSGREMIEASSGPSATKSVYDCDLDDPIGRFGPSRY